MDAGRLSQAAKLCVLPVLHCCRLPRATSAAADCLPACLLLLLLRARRARRYQELAELLEAEGMPVEAIENYEKASDLFLAENSTSSSHKALIRVAHLAATLEPPELERAADTFTKVGSECLTNNLLKFQAKGYFFNAFLCILARTDVVAADGALARFKEMDYTFPGSRECKLCDDVLQSFKDLNADAFTDAVFNYDQISKLDPWKTTCVARARLCLLPSRRAPARSPARSANLPPFLPPPHPHLAGCCSRSRRHWAVATVAARAAAAAAAAMG